MQEDYVPKSLMELDGQLGRDEAHVWLANADTLQSNDQAKFLDLLNDDERRRADRFKVNPAREQFVASRGLLRIVLGKYLGIEPRQISFRVSTHGKPELLEDQGLFFNLSHTAGLTAIAVTRLGAIGVDVEQVGRRPVVLDLANRFFSLKEATWVSAQPEDRRSESFFACWTAKEAYIKAHGEGMSIPLGSFAIVPDPGRQRMNLEVFENPAESYRWFLWRLDLSDDFKGALAVEAQRCSVRIGSLVPESG